jgi:hypothetical protein
MGTLIRPRVGAIVLESRILSAEVRLRVDAVHETASDLIDEQESTEIETCVNEPHWRYAIVIDLRGALVRRLDPLSSEVEYSHEMPGPL